MTSAAEGEPKELWRFEKLAAFVSPPASLSEVTRTGLRGLVERIRDEARLTDELSESDPLSPIEPSRLAELIPQPPIDHLCDALSTALEPWPDAPSRSPVRLVVHGYPELGAEASAAFARLRGWQWIEPPFARELLAADRSFLVDRLPPTDEPIVIDRLERWFLRQPRALEAMRELLGALAQRRAPTLVSCGSWAYAWLQGALYANTVLIEPLALAAFDADALSTWLGSVRDGTLRVREHGKGLILPGSGPAGQDEGSPRSDFLRHLVAEARGNSHIASGLWALALRQPTAGEGGLEVQVEGDELAGTRDELIAVRWSDWARPTLGRLARPEEAALLHALVMHGSLSLEVLERVLPFGHSAITRALASFEAQGLAELEATDQWRITTAGYPAVRRELMAAGHPGDGL